MYPGRPDKSADRWHERENYPSNQHSPSPGLRKSHHLPANLNHLRVTGSSSYAQYDNLHKDSKLDIKYKGHKTSREHWIPVEDELAEAIQYKRNRAIKGEKVIEDSNNHFEQTNPQKITHLHPSMRGLAQGYKRRGRKGRYAWRGQIEIVDQPGSASSIRYSRDLTKEEKRIKNLKALDATVENPKRRISTPTHKIPRPKGRSSAMMKEIRDRDQIFDAPELQSSNNQASSFPSKPRTSKMHAEFIHSDSMQRGGGGYDNQSQLNETQTVQSGNYDGPDYQEPTLNRRQEYNETLCIEEFANTTGIYGAGVAINGPTGMDFSQDDGNLGSNRYGTNPLTPNPKGRTIGPNKAIRTPGRTGQSNFREYGVTTLHDNSHKQQSSATQSSRQGDQKTPFYIDIGPVSTIVEEPVRKSSNPTITSKPNNPQELSITSPAAAQRLTPSTVTAGTSEYKHMVSQIAKVFEISEQEVLTLAKSNQHQLQEVVSHLCANSTLNICRGGDKGLPNAINAD